MSHAPGIKYNSAKLLFFHVREAEFSELVVAAVMKSARPACVYHSHQRTKKCVPVFFATSFRTAPE